ncbi:hypothetical protein KUTeg_012762 [Tegillarca granosa]|uniref:INTS4 8 helical bundle domain-containing protein n=1 Tax=Tegillarca granosa TaxID=220873 RepID=A0ABQ9F0I2_TEGGR|nr:hypothetical protein KUTeg_012762 [Tegillarca granosa]
MAALLKKRAVAQFSQVIQEEAKPIKKLKLVHRPPSFVSLDLQSVATSHDALQRLLHFEEDLSITREAAPNIVRELLDYFHKEKEPLVRCKIAFILGEIVKLPDFNSESLVDDIMLLLKSEKSHKVIGKLIEVLEVIGKSTPQNAELHKQLIDNVQQYLKDPSHIARCSCVNLIGSIGSPDQVLEAGANLEENISVQSLLTSLTRDQDPRVRSSALKAMEACNSLKDDYEGVRLAAIKLIWVLSHQFPESNVTVPDSQEEIRLVDDGFAKICDMVNDISVKVRVEASSLLGSLHQVSAKFLDQTLDKKLMSNMRVCGWSTGQKWADDAPKQELEAEDVSLMNIGACGAFVHGTEDEFLEVRNAALDSLCELAVQSESFANKSQDYIIDMFNDEIESVRQNAINSLRKLSHLITLREDQLEIILGVLQIPGRTDLCVEISDAPIPDTTNFVQQSLRQLDNIVSMDTTTAEEIDLKQIIQLDEKVSASAECVCMFLQSQLLLTKLMTSNHWMCTNSVTDENILNTVDNILRILQKIELLFLGLGNTELAMVRQTQLKAQCLQILIQLKTDSKQYVKLKAEFLQALNQTNK